jgi:hypothetical protein
MTCFWAKDGQPIEENSHYVNAHSTRLLVRQFGTADGGVYQLTASNSFGMTTAPIRQAAVHCVDAGSAVPTPPYTDWQGAATNIQDAVDAAVPWDVVLVTNGIYAHGGATDGVWADRVFFGGKFGLLLMSLNGPGQTVIEGQRASAASNAPGAVRCVQAFGGAVSGFTVRNGEVTNSPSSPATGGGHILWNRRLLHPE